MRPPVTPLAVLAALALAPLASAGELDGAAPHLLAPRASQVWSFDETTTGQDILWTSPTAVDPASVAYDLELSLTAVDVTVEFLGGPFGPIDVLAEVPTEELPGVVNFAGPAPVGGDTLSIVFPEPPEPTSLAGDIDVGIDAGGNGFFNFTNVVLGDVTVDLGFPFGSVTVPILSIRVAGEVTATETRWTEVGGGVAGVNGLPRLRGEGTLVGGDPQTMTMTDGLPSGGAFFIMGFSQLNAPFKGGTLVPSVDILVSGLPTDVDGGLVLPLVMPLGVPSDAVISFQIWMQDVAGIFGFSATNGLTATTP